MEIHEALEQLEQQDNAVEYTPIVTSGKRLSRPANAAGILPGRSEAIPLRQGCSSLDQARLMMDLKWPILFIHGLISSQVFESNNNSMPRTYTELTRFAISRVVKADLDADVPDEVLAQRILDDCNPLFVEYLRLASPATGWSVGSSPSAAWLSGNSWNAGNKRSRKDRGQETTFASRRSWCDTTNYGSLQGPFLTTPEHVLCYGILKAGS